MTKLKAALVFQDSGTFDANRALFAAHLSALDADLAPTLAAKLADTSNGSLKREELLDQLMQAMIEAEARKAGADAPPDEGQAAPAEPSSLLQNTTAPPNAAAAPPLGWFLEKLEIEGFRGINNEGAPLALKFKPDAVSSISAPNGVGKSSIFDALTYALRGSIPKLENLAASEKGQEYYLNRFHRGGVGRVSLTVKPTDGSPSITVTVSLDDKGSRSVVATNGTDGEALLAELGREFVLLDGPTFHRFIDDTSLARGRNFAGLLGLSRYSAVRGALDNLSNTRAFNNHFDRTAVLARKQAAAKSVAEITPRIGADYESLIKSPLEPATARIASQAVCCEALRGIPALATHCEGKVFGDIDLDACIETITAEEGGEKKKRHGDLLRKAAELKLALTKGPSDEDQVALTEIAARRDAAVSQTSGDLLHELYRASEKVLTSQIWTTPNTCPTCERVGESAVLDVVQAKIAEYERVDEETQAGILAWGTGAWSDLAPLFEAHLESTAAAECKTLIAKGAKGELTAADVLALSGHRTGLGAIIKSAAVDSQAELDQLAKELPPSLVAATAAVETGRRLQNAWKEIARHESTEAKEAALEARIARLKSFVDRANDAFAHAESTIANERLQKVLPVCRELFKAIMGHSVVPALAKRTGTEELTISLAEFWSLKDVSAQALLSESFRNGFAVSVYLAAASLYGGAPKFMILDDVTSSFDAGHQLNLIEVIRFQFARPKVADGPQMIILSHDSMLEKLFNSHNGSTEWQHQRLEGSPQMAVLPQSGAINKVRDGTIDLLNQGRAADAAPFVRQYLEYQLSHIISRCRIPVPFDVAFSDEKKMVSNLLAAIQDAVALNKKAGHLVLDAAQELALEQRAMTITSNFVSHWATGSTNAYSAPALQTVMTAIDALEDVFQHQPASGGPKVFYRSLSQK